MEVGVARTGLVDFLFLEGFEFVEHLLVLFLISAVWVGLSRIIFLAHFIRSNLIIKVEVGL